MIVTHKFANGKESVIFSTEIKFPNGPLSHNIDDVIEFLEWSIPNLKEAIEELPAGDKNKQSLRVEYDNQVKTLNKLRSERAAELNRKLDKPLA